MSRQSLIEEYWRSFPYGLWTCEDGREVLFNRRYEPIVQRLGGVVSDADPKERIPFKTQRWFYDDGDSPVYDKPTRKVVRQVLAEFRDGRDVTGYLDGVVE